MVSEKHPQLLLYIEPTIREKLKIPYKDEIVEKVEKAISKGKKGIFHSQSINKELVFQVGKNWFGWHQTECGKCSDSKDVYLENGMITNSLAPFYLKWYRNSISDFEMEKVYKLINKIKPEELAYRFCDEEETICSDIWELLKFSDGFNFFDDISDDIFKKYYPKWDKNKYIKLHNSTYTGRTIINKESRKKLKEYLDSLKK